MKRSYKKEFPEITDIKRIQNMDIRGIYIIPDKAYNGFWGKNGFKSFDFILEGIEGEKRGGLGWLHWEGDVISIVSGEFEIEADCAVGNDYIRLFNGKGLILEDLQISRLTIRGKEKTDDKQ